MILAIVIAALISVESGGNAHAVGDNGRAHGQLQIHSIVVRDVNRIAGTRYTLASAYSRAESEQICRLYLEHYATRERLGHEPTPQDAARIWAGGPRGHEKTATLAYWRKVRAHMPLYFAATP
jgi:hypothetical protein